MATLEHQSPTIKKVTEIEEEEPPQQPPKQQENPVVHKQETITFINEKGQVEYSDPSPVEQVRLTVSNEDDPTLPVWTFRSWLLGLISCVLLSFVNTFFSYRTEPVIITMITVQVISLPMGRFLANVLPTKKFKIGSLEFSVNPGPFNVKEHVLISLFANAGSAFGAGTAYAQGIVDIIKVFYHRKISFMASWILIITTQVLGYGWAGILRKYVVDPAYMWWPTSLVQVSLFRAMHEKEDRKEKTPDGKRTKRTMSRNTFFIIALISSFAYHVIPEYLFATLQSMAWLCWVYPKSIFIQQLGSGFHGLGLGTFGFDWGVIVSFLGSPLATPLYVVINILVGYIMMMYVVTPLSYWGLNLYGARKYPIFSQELFDFKGGKYNTSAIVNDKFELDIGAYDAKGKIYLSTFFAVTYGIGFATVVATLTHVALFYGREICKQFRASRSEKEDIHTKLMRRYKDIPGWWFHLMLFGSIALSLALCIFMKDEVQLPWWGLLLAAAIALIFTLPISIITATTNQTPGLNIITEYLMGVLLPGRPIANVCFKTYGYISMAQAVSFLNDFKLGHYMKIPPRTMFMVQFIGTILAGTVNLGVAWWLLTSIPNICDAAVLPPSSPWTCPSDAVFFDASVIWGLVGPRRIFGPLGDYSALNWFFLGGALAPILVWLLHKMFPRAKWIRLINMPVLLGSTAMMPPATSVNYNSWIVVAVIFSWYVFYYRKKWWQKYNYVLSASLDAGLAFFVILKFFGFGMKDMSIDWWGGSSEHCDLAKCPTAKGVVVDGCPVF